MYSHSALSCYQQCPYLYYHRYVLKDLPYVPHPAAERGAAIHNAIAAHRPGAPTPRIPWLTEAAHQVLADWLGLADGPVAAKHNVKLGMTAAGEPVSYSRAWFGGSLDYLVTGADAGVVVDWKSGSSKYGTKDQDSQYAALVLANYPTLTEVTTAWVYFDDAVIEQTFGRSDFPWLHRGITDVVADIEADVASGEFRQKPSGLCKTCPVKTCPRNRS